MKWVKLLKQVRPKMFGKLLWLSLTHLPYVIPTFLATRQCMALSTELYGRKHYQNGPENAFRHALWNYLIAKRCFRWWKSEPKVLLWTKKITDWHEDAFVNTELAWKMDEHNNAIGRELFAKHGLNQEKSLAVLKEMTLASFHITTETDLEKFKQQLVHIKTT
ncbi:MAG: hypothetical protein AAF554_17550 [Bacteroidota bacterium]